MDNQISSDIIRGHIDSIILNTLVAGDKNAQQISDAIFTESKGCYQINQATLYSSLKRLESLKYISSYWNDAEEGRRKFFNITELGKNYIKENLVSWEYSRDIINKLIGSEPIISVNNDSKTNNFDAKSPIIKFQTTPDENKIVSKPENHFNNDKVSENYNFRNILEGLFDKNKPEKEKIDEIKPENKIEKEVPKFTETIGDDHKNSKTTIEDLKEKAEKEGFKIRFSSADSAKNAGKLLINKLNLYSIFIVFILGIIEFLLLKSIFLNGKMNFIINLISIIVLSLFPIYFTIKYIINKKRTTSKKMGIEGIITALIVDFNLLLLTFALDFIFNVDFSDKIQTITFLIVPILILIDIVVFFVIRSIFSKKKNFQLKN